jgi:hypothetical protein
MIGGDISSRVWLAISAERSGPDQCKEDALDAELEERSRHVAVVLFNDRARLTGRARTVLTDRAHHP